MATTSEVKAGLDDISKIIRTERQTLKNLKARLTASKNTLNALPSTFNNVVVEINGMPGNGTAFEQISKDELAKLSSEYNALLTDINTAETALASLTEF